MIRLFANTTITGGKLTLKKKYEDFGGIGIFLGVEEGAATLTIKDADIEMVGDGLYYGITGEEGSSLIIDNSDISIPACDYGCICDWSGITLSNCYIEEPVPSVIKADGIYEVDDFLVGTGGAAETLVIKAGEMTGIASQESRVESQESRVFDLQGRKVTNPEKGKIYILNGKKVKR